MKGKFDDSTAQLFRSLQKGNSGFDHRSINNVRLAAELSSISSRHTTRPIKPAYRGPSTFVQPYNSAYNRSSGEYFRERRDGLFQNLQGSRFRNPHRGQNWQNRDQDQ